MPRTRSKAPQTRQPGPKMSKMRFSGAEYLLTAAVGSGLAFQALPDEELQLFGAYAKPTVSIVLGGLYAIEKMRQFSRGSTEGSGDQNASNGHTDGKNELSRIT